MEKMNIVVQINPIYDELKPIPFVAIINGIDFTGNYGFKYSRGVFIVRFDNPLVSKHPEYKRIRTEILKTHLLAVRIRYGSLSLVDSAIKALKRAGVDVSDNI